jgi:hypothetical protein
MQDNLPYKDYDDWFDNGPGSEAFKRLTRETVAPLAFPFFSNPSTTPELKTIAEVEKKKPTVLVTLSNSDGTAVLVAEIDPNEKYWEADVPKRKTLVKYINGLLR